MRRAALLAVVGVVVLIYSSLAPAQSTSAAQSTSTSLGTAAVAGTTIKVNTNADESNTDGDYSLREAIKSANTNKAVDGCAAGSSAEQDAIHFALGTQATITLGSTLPSITDPSGLSIDGQKAKITVSGDDKVRVFGVRPGGKLALLHLTVANGLSRGPGSGLSNGGQVKVSNSTFSDNRARKSGGGILNLGTLTVSNSTFSGNHTAGTRGGGISNNGTLTVSSSTFSGNLAVLGSGGGISNFDGTATVRNSTFSGNSSSFDTSGGGIENDQGTLTVINSTFSGNYAAGGGGIENFRGTLKVINSTFSKNSSFPDFASGIENFGAGTATLKNTIVANSTKGKNCFGKIIDGGYNLEDGTSCGFSAAKNSLRSTNPKLASSLANNGGPTKTIKLLEGSPAINAIPKTRNGCGTQITTDQRGVTRPQGKGCEIGAFEKKVRCR